ncbi:MAG TPA: hypothetical protein VKT80_13100 [Chloroflexota bacterium]|nr:hypothetical protein [Chloroflexota bacterium]
MARDRFCFPGTKRIDISDGDHIIVKTGLTAGEKRRMDNLAVSPIIDNGKYVGDRVDFTEYEFLRTDLWITDWSITREIDGRVVKIPKSVSSLKAMEEEDFEEINQAVFKHIMEWMQSKKSQRAARNAGGNSLPSKSTTAPSSEATSPLSSGSDSPPTTH